MRFLRIIYGFVKFYLLSLNFLVSLCLTIGSYGDVVQSVELNWEVT